MEACSLRNLLESLDQLNDKCLIALFITFYSVKMPSETHSRKLFRNYYNIRIRFCV